MEGDVTMERLLIKAKHSQIQAVSSEAHHEEWLPFLGTRCGSFLDIGAASGRDVHWFASRGWRVTAVEDNLQWERLYDGDANVEWIHDKLPNLLSLISKPQYDAILVSNQWPRLSRIEQQQALLRLFGLLKPDGLLVVTWSEGGEYKNAHPVDLLPFRKALIVEGPDAIDPSAIMYTAIFGANQSL